MATQFFRASFACLLLSNAALKFPVCNVSGPLPPLDKYTSLSLRSFQFPDQGRKTAMFSSAGHRLTSRGEDSGSSYFCCTSAHLLSEDIFKLKMPVIFTHFVSRFFS